MGDLQPRYSQILHFWLTDDLGGLPSLLGRFFEVSADEIDHVRMRIMVPEYVMALVRKYAFISAIVTVPIIIAVLLWLGPHKR